MPTTSAPETTFVAEPGSHATTTTSVIDAPRENVYRAYTEADLLVRWWGPRELTTRVDTYEPRPGGSWRLVHTDPDGNEYAFRGVFHDMVPNERIVQTFEFEGFPGTVMLESLTLAEEGGKTLLTATSKLESGDPAAVEAMVDSGMAEGAAETYDRLEELAQELAKRS